MQTNAWSLFIKTSSTVRTTQWCRNVLIHILKLQYVNNLTCQTATILTYNPFNERKVTSDLCEAIMWLFSVGPETAYQSIEFNVCYSKPFRVYKEYKDSCKNNASQSSLMTSNKCVDSAWVILLVFCIVLGVSGDCWVFFEWCVYQKTPTNPAKRTPSNRLNPPEQSFKTCCEIDEAFWIFPLPSTFF